jgi:hypothetical protein
MGIIPGPIMDILIILYRLKKKFVSDYLLEPISFLKAERADPITWCIS